MYIYVNFNLIQVTQNKDLNHINYLHLQINKENIYKTFLKKTVKT